jgi:hypothetical protein
VFLNSQALATKNDLPARPSSVSVNVIVINMPEALGNIRYHTPSSRERSMQSPPLDPDVADTAPSDAVLTAYDRQHLVTYLRLLDAEADGADWQDVAGIVLHRDAHVEPDRARRALESHLARAKWMTEHGYRQLLAGSVTSSWLRTLRCLAP